MLVIFLACADDDSPVDGGRADTGAKTPDAGMKASDAGGDDADACLRDGQSTDECERGSACCELCCPGSMCTISTPHTTTCLF
jgi:hypothetical protein